MGNEELREIELELETVKNELMLALDSNYVLTGQVQVLENKLVRMKEVANDLVDGLDQILLKHGGL